MVGLNRRGIRKDTAREEGNAEGDSQASSEVTGGGGGGFPSEAGSTRGMEQEKGREHELHLGHAFTEEPVDTQQRCRLCSQSRVQESGARVERQVCFLCV